MPDLQSIFQPLTLAATVFGALLAFFALLLRRGQRRTADLQVSSALLIAFQSAWQERTAKYMRLYLRRKPFHRLFMQALEEAYDCTISPEHIDDSLIDFLLRTSCLRREDHDDPLELFTRALEDKNHAISYDPAYEGGRERKPLFTILEALDMVLESFDRLAIVRNKPQAIEFIELYKPPIRDLSGVLQACIAVRIALRSEKEEDRKRRNFKKDYMLLLHHLSLHNETLFDICMEGLEERGELDEKELRREERVKRKYLSFN